MSETETERVLIRSGLSTMRRAGFHAVGVQVILDKANVPKGSFYHHFKSKEKFGAEVLAAYYADHAATALSPFLSDQAVSARARLINYFSYMSGLMEKGGFICGCLVGNIVLETADTSTALRKEASRIFAEWRSAIEECVEAAQADGEVAPDLPARQIAEFILSAWEGALLRSKSDRNPAPLQAFQQVLADKILR